MRATDAIRPGAEHDVGCTTRATWRLDDCNCSALPPSWARRSEEDAR